LAATSLSNVFMGAHMVHVMNEMKVDYVAVGNHEFDYGPLQLKRRVKESKFDWIATNVLESDGEHVFEGCLPHKFLNVASHL
jgi:2',3'-cyclic-nucleotide 2'-phosphodiesterase (5'-nucleotidase family)